MSLQDALLALSASGQGILSGRLKGKLRLQQILQQNIENYMQASREREQERQFGETMKYHKQALAQAEEIKRFQDETRRTIADYQNELGLLKFNMQQQDKEKDRELRQMYLMGVLGQGRERLAGQRTLGAKDILDIKKFVEQENVGRKLAGLPLLDTKSVIQEIQSYQPQTTALDILGGDTGTLVPNPLPGRPAPRSAKGGLPDILVNPEKYQTPKEVSFYPKIPTISSFLSKLTPSYGGGGTKETGIDFSKNILKQRQTGITPQTDIELTNEEQDLVDQISQRLSTGKYGIKNWDDIAKANPDVDIEKVKRYFGVQ